MLREFGGVASLLLPGDGELRLEWHWEEENQSVIPEAARKNPLPTCHNHGETNRGV